ncbi:unnamed protein product [Vitrella brassicaformis CCMP3155]|uniref:Peroxisomal membrane protein 2 n=1 Tax=Vitrella brassicaformis (strain CCMP3155) TaxID=1169540 RepID=A0A0G4FTH6_VITBC|nr:unnamed protein product [Vitrella brassicaformis CCMP3155]|eukprot:CEM18202.1 unnamed protein product [Vitrella brassicaformis CCMP3155]
MALVQSSPSSSPAAAKVLAIADLYLSLLSDYPLRTKSLTCGVLSAVSDLLSQYLIQTKHHVPVEKMVFTRKSAQRQFVIGLIVRGPVLHYWFGWVERLFQKWPPQGSKTVLTKVVFDQLVFAPFFLALNFVVVGLAEGRSPQAIARELQSRLFDVWKKNVCLWPIVGLIQYRYVPPKLRVFVGNLVSVFWTAYLLSRISPGVVHPKQVIKPSRSRTEDTPSTHASTDAATARGSRAGDGEEGRESEGKAATMN